MKNLSLTLAAVSLAILSACGTNLKTPKQAASTTYDATTASAAWGKDFADGCASRNGQLLKSGELCIFTKFTKPLANEANGESDELTSLDIGAVADGDAVQAIGWASNSAVLVAVDGAVVSAVPSPNNTPVTVARGGKLEYQLRPGGRFSGVKVLVYGCVDKNLNTERCPY